jgi:hypothetical protein
MEPTTRASNDRTPYVFGLLLVAIGAAVLVLRLFDVDALAAVRDLGWQLFIIVPGLGLLAMALVPKPPNGAGFAIAGSIVTTVGLILAYQEANDAFESWSYAWALLPGAAGLAMTVYGFFANEHTLVAGGLRIAVIAAALFVAGYWFFETTFATGRAPLDLETWWPVLVIAIGGLITISALLGRDSGAPSRTTPEPGL